MCNFYITKKKAPAMDAFSVSFLLSIILSTSHAKATAYPNKVLIPAIAKYPNFLDIVFTVSDRPNKIITNIFFLFPSDKLTYPPLKDHLYIIR